LQEFKEAEPWSAASLARPKRSAPWSAPRFRLLQAYGAIRQPPDGTDRTLPKRQPTISEHQQIIDRMDYVESVRITLCGH